MISLNHFSTMWKSDIYLIDFRGIQHDVAIDTFGVFKGAAPVVTNWKSIPADPDILDYAAKDNIAWKFITERSPWKGGLWERLIALIKNCLKHGIGRKRLNEEEFATYVKEAQAIVNSRPLTDVNDESVPLRPQDFLTPEAHIGLPMFNNDSSDDPSYIPTSTTKNKMLVYMEKTTQCLDRYWKKWHHEYLARLRDTSAVLHNQKGIDVLPEIGDVVMIETEENIPRGNWSLGRVEQLHRSPDNEIRAVTVKTKNGTLKRSPAHLYPLEANLEPKPVQRSDRKSVV